MNKKGRKEKGIFKTLKWTTDFLIYESFCLSSKAVPFLKILQKP